LLVVELVVVELAAVVAVAALDELAVELAVELGVELTELVVICVSIV
jgi:hypothetical protein